MIDLGPDNGARLAAMFRENLYFKDTPMTTPPPMISAPDDRQSAGQRFHSSAMQQSLLFITLCSFGTVKPR
jgi:hypothetical protein